MDKFLYLKLGRGNCLARYWLSKDNVFKKPAVAIFFGKITTEKCRKLSAMSKEELKSFKSESIGAEDIRSYRDIHYQIKPFIEAGDDRRARFVTIVHGNVYIYKPDSPVFDMPKALYDEYDFHLSQLGIKPKKKTIDEHFPKVIFVKNIKRLTEFPHVLATLQCSQYLTRGTCREINPSRDWGAIQAIKHCLGEPIEKPEADEQIMSLLGWHQLETLVFLILKNSGVFPSAWRGGSLPDVDIVATNYSYSEVRIGTNPQIIFEPMKRKTFQIKRGRVEKPFENSDYTVAMDFRGKDNEKILTSKWLLEQIEDQPDTKDWFEKSLYWTSLFRESQTMHA